MSKFVTISYYPYYVMTDATILYGNGSAETPFRITLNIDSIMSINREPRSLNTYDSYELRLSGNSVLKDVYLLETNAGVGRGINGVVFRTYFLTKESYIHLIDFLDPIST